MHWLVIQYICFLFALAPPAIIGLYNCFRWCRWLLQLLCDGRDSLCCAVLVILILRALYCVLIEVTISFSSPCLQLLTCYIHPLDAWWLGIPGIEHGLFMPQVFCSAVGEMYCTRIPLAWLNSLLFACLACNPTKSLINIRWCCSGTPEFI